MRIAVRDDGPGIAPEHHGLIFEKFGRAGTGSAKPGTGLGLFIARSIAEAHGGTLDVQSALGRGSTFTVLPARLGAFAPPSSRPSCFARAAIVFRSDAGSSTIASPRSARISVSSHSSDAYGRSATADPSRSGCAPRSTFQRAIGFA